MFNEPEFILHTFSSLSDYNKMVKNRYLFTWMNRKLWIKPDEILNVVDDHFDVPEACAVGIYTILLDHNDNQCSLYTLRFERITLESLVKLLGRIMIITQNRIRSY